MANRPLKSIKFPGLDDTYTVPQIDDTLAVAGKAADAKAVGDAIANVEIEVDATLSTAGKAADAKAAGDAVAELKSDLIALEQEGYPMASISEAVDAWVDDHEAEIVNSYVTPEQFGAIENGICNITKFQTMLANHKYIKFISDFELQFIANSTVDSPTRIKIENKKGIVIDGGGHTVTMSGLTKVYLESINDRSSSGRDIFSFLAFHGCEDITVKNINIVGTNASDAQNSFRFASPRSIGIAFKGCKNAYVENVNGTNILGNVVNATSADDLTTGCDKVIVSDCKAVNCYENGFNFMGNTTDSIIDSCESIRCGTGIEAFGDTCLIQNCLVRDAWSSGISVSGGATAKNNKVIGSLGTTVGDGIGIAVTGVSTLISKNCKVLNNHIVDCNGYGFYVYPYTENTEIKGNVFEYNGKLNPYGVANNISGVSTNKTKNLIIDSNIFKSVIDDQKCFMADNINGVLFVNNTVEHSLPTAVYSINFSGSCENFKACGNTLIKRVNASGTPTNYFIGNNVVGKTIPDPVTDA